MNNRTIRASIRRSIALVDDRFGLWELRYFRKAREESTAEQFLTSRAGRPLPLLVFADDRALEEFLYPTVSFEHSGGDVVPTDVAARNYVRRCRQVGATPAAATIAEWVEHLGLPDPPEMERLAEPYDAFSRLYGCEVAPEKMSNLTRWSQFSTRFETPVLGLVEKSPILQFLFVEHLKSLVGSGVASGIPSRSFVEGRRRGGPQDRSMPLDVQLAMPGAPR